MKIKVTHKNIENCGKVTTCFYVRTKVFDQRCNHESVSLMPLELHEDVTFVKELLAEFHKKTGSTLAMNVLNNWAQEQGNFVKVDVTCFHHYSNISLTSISGQYRSISWIKNVFWGLGFFCGTFNISW